MPTALPIQEIRQELLSHVVPGGQCVVTAPTGSGKSTQIPQWLLEALPETQKILILQPRRLAARMLAERVAWELGEKPGQRVGFVTRYERAISAQTRILFVTEGILTRMLLNPKELADFGAIVFDEFHERTLNADLGLAMAHALRKNQRPDLRLIVMSATLAADSVAEYLDKCPILRAEGRRFPVELSYTQRSSFHNLYQATADALRDLLDSGTPGDILVFLPGAGEIRHAQEAIEATRYAEPLAILPLYGEMPPEAQHAVMAPSPRRKVILATNIAETSLTIPGVRMVIDSGLVKLSRYDAARGVDILETVPISDDSAQQRAGRAGREAPGKCRRLWSALEQDHKTPHTPPEIQRMDLADAILNVHCYGYADDTVFPWYEAPPEKGALSARILLKNLGLLDESGKVTQDGLAVRAFPTHPRLALMLLLGARRGVFEEASGAAALLGGRPLMMRHGAAGILTQQRNAIRRENRNSNAPQSDFTAQLSLLKEAQKLHFDTDACARLGIQSGPARDITREWNDFLRMQPRDAAQHSESPATVLAQILLECFPDRLARRIDTATLNCELQGRRRAVLSPQSLARDEKLFIAAEMREISGGQQPGTTTELSLASGIREEWLWERYADELLDEDVPFWDGVRQQVLRRRTLSCLGLVLEESTRNDPDPEKAAQLLFQEIQSTNNLPLLGWDESCDSWCDRVRFLRERFPNLALPEYTPEECDQIRRQLCEGETKYSVVRNKPALPFLQAFLTPEQRTAVERLAPATLPLPRNRKLRLEYHPGLPPKGRAKLQELYDVNGPITVGGGKIPVLLDILAPNFRTVQITDDLPRFWQVHYPAIKSQLQRRYPKHEWR